MIYSKKLSNDETERRYMLFILELKKVIVLLYTYQLNYFHTN